MENILPVLMKSIGMKTSQHPPCSPSPANGLPNGAELLLDTLLACGVDTVFGYPGGAALPLYDALYLRPALRHVLVRHEQAAVHAAEGYARSTGRVGVVLVTSGPGVSNTITGLLDAHSDAVPVLCISGQVATSVIGTQAFQESDALGMSRPVTKWNCQLHDAAQTVSAVRNALRVAASGKPGPVLLDVPKDVQLQRPRRQVEVSVPESGPAPSALPQPGLLQQQDAARQVAGVVGQGHAVAFLQLRQALALLGIHAHGRDRALHQGLQVQLAVTLELVEIHLMLEEVGIE